MSYVLYPRISEKAFKTAGDLNCYTFVVPEDINKFDVKNEIEKQYDVTVLSVNVSVLKGKSKRFMMKRGKTSNGTRQNVRKAYVTLKEGDSIPVFAAQDEEPSTPPVTTGRVKTKKEKK